MDTDVTGPHDAKIKVGFYDKRRAPCHGLGRLVAVTERVRGGLDGGRCDDAGHEKAP